MLTLSAVSYVATTVDSVTSSPPIIDLDSSHPLFGVRSLRYDTRSGLATIRLTNGTEVRANIGPESSPAAIVETHFEPARSVLRMSTASGTEFEFDIGFAGRQVGAPVVYLDQNHWIDLARATTGSAQLAAPKRQACEYLIELARAQQIRLPLSAGHVVETAKKGGRQRIDVASTMATLSRGWQMRSPLRIRAYELDRLMRVGTDGRDQELDVFTLEPNAIWADRLWSPQRPGPTHDLPSELAGLTARISWAAAFADVLLEPKAEVSEAGLNVAELWASSFASLAQHMRGNPKAKQYARDLTRTRMVTDIQHDLAIAASKAGRTPEEFASWLRHDADVAFSTQPALSRVRELLHFRLMNADDRWERNDLNDVFYLSAAAGYADIVVSERKTGNYLKRCESDVPRGAKVCCTMEETVTALVDLT